MPLPWNAWAVSSSARRSVVAGVVVGERDRVETGGGEPGEDRRGRGERVGTLAWSSRLRQRALEVSDGEVCRGQPARHRPQRSGGVAGAPSRRPDPAAEHDVADDRERRDRGRRRPGHPQRILGSGCRNGSTPATTIGRIEGPTSDAGSTATTRGSLASARVAASAGPVTTRSAVVVPSNDSHVCTRPAMILRASGSPIRGAGRVGRTASTRGSRVGSLVSSTVGSSVGWSVGWSVGSTVGWVRWVRQGPSPGRCG